MLSLRFLRSLASGSTIRSLRALFLTTIITIPAATWAAPKVIVISLDGATPRLVQFYLTVGILNPQEGLGLLQKNGVVALRNTVASPSLTAPGHIMIATGSTAVKND